MEARETDADHTELQDTRRHEPHGDQQDSSSRRAVLRTAAAAGAGALAGVIAAGRPVGAGDSGGAATDGNAFELGEINTSTVSTAVEYTGSGAIQDGAFRGTSFLYGATDPPNAGDGNDIYPGAVGGYGKGNVPNGVHGSTTSPIGLGVVAANLAPGTGVAGAVPKALGVAAPNGIHVFLMRFPGAGVGPMIGDHVPGELYFDGAGTLWFSVPVSGGLEWRTLTASGAAGSYYPIAPIRAYDSRQSAYAVSGRLAPNTSRVVTLANSHATDGTVIATDVVPAGATAAMVNLTVVDPTDQNFISVAPGDVTSTATSIVNWADGDRQTANAVVVGMNTTRQIRVFCGDQPGATHVVVDVFGYYR